MSGERVDVASLLAKEAIREALFAGLDAWRRRDWVAMRAGFTPEARVEGALFAIPFDTGVAAPAMLEVDEALRQVAEAMRRHGASSLLASNCRIALGEDGAKARLSALILAAHEPLAEQGERTRLEALRFEDDWSLDSDGPSRREWRVALRRVERLWCAWLDPRRDDRVGDHRHATEWTR